MNCSPYWRCPCRKCKLGRYALALALLLVVVLLVNVAAFAQLATDININQSANNCGAAAQLIFAANGKRQSFLIVANAANTASIFIGKNSAVTTSNGIPIAPGQNFSDNSYIGTWYCIAAANQNFTAYETTR